MTPMHFAINRTGTVQRISHAGRQYLTVPVVAIRAGVLNGELVPAEEIGAIVESWAGIPVPVRHPQRNGQYVSANSPDIVAECPGRFWYPRMEGGALKGDIWLDVAHCEALGGDAQAVLQALEAGTPMDVSTGYWRDPEEVQGNHLGKPYMSIAHNIRPDHLALLPDEIGACSWADGCGAPRVNQEARVDLTIHQQHSGAMVALYPPEEVARALAMDPARVPPGGRAIPWEELHLTLLYFGEAAEQPAPQSEALAALAEISRYLPLVRGQISGTARFRGEGEDAYVLLYDSPGLIETRAVITQYMDWHGLKPSQKHGFTPHITLAYLPQDAAIPPEVPEATEVILPTLGLAWGDAVTLFPLQGEARPTETQQGAGFLASLVSQIAGLFGLRKESDSNPTPSQEEDMPGEEKEKMVDPETPAANATPCGCADKAAPATHAAPTPVANADLADAIMLAVQAAVAPLELRLNELGRALTDQEASTKAELIGALTANSACAFEQAELEAWPLAQLQKLSATLTPADYSGRALPRVNQSSEWEDYQAPTASARK